jgi:hypothetical protein
LIFIKELLVKMCICNRVLLSYRRCDFKIPFSPRIFGLGCCHSVERMVREESMEVILQVLRNELESGFQCSDTQSGMVMGGYSPGSTRFVLF